MKKKLLISLVFACMMLLGITQVAFASIGQLEVDTNDGNGYQNYDTDTYLTLHTTSNIISVRAQVYNVEEFSIDDETISVPSDDQADYTDEFNKVILKSGLNKISVEALNNDNDTQPGKTVKQTINIYYHEAFAGGSTYVEDFLSKGKVDVFEKNISIEFPKNNYIVDASNTIIDDQIVKFSVTEATYETIGNDYFYPMSKLIEITSNDTTGDKIMLPGTITMNYNVNSPAWETVSIWYDDGTSGWEKIGAVIDGKKKTATTNFRGFGKYVVANGNKFFDDYATKGWAKAYAEPLWAKGIMLVRTDDNGLVGTDANSDLGLSFDCTRGEFTSMIIKSMGLLGTNVVDGNRRFDDLKDAADVAIEAQSVDKSYIETAAALGLVNGVDNTTFAPLTTLNRAQAAAILARVMELDLTITPKEINNILDAKFIPKDVADIPEWARPYVAAAVDAGYFEGRTLFASDKAGLADEDLTKLKFVADGTLNRAEAAALVYRVMKDKKRI